MPKRYVFIISLQGTGKTPWEAWNDAVEHFALDPGVPPEGDLVQLECNDCGTLVGVKTLSDISECPNCGQTVQKETCRFEG